MEIYHPRDEELLREMRRVRRSRKRSRLLWGFLISLVLCAAVGFFVFTQLYAVAVVSGSGMGDTLPAGSLVLARRHPADGVHPGDIVLFNKEETQLVKRVLAVGGDNVVLSPYTRNEIRVNGQPLEEAYVIGRSSDAGVTARRTTVPEGELFVAGDQRALSMDSRFRDYGTIPESEVVGRVDVILWPIYKLGTLHDEDLGTLLSPLFNRNSDSGGTETSRESADSEDSEDSRSEGTDGAESSENAGTQEGES